VRNQQRAVKSSPGPIGAASRKDVFSPGLELNGFFVAHANRASVGDPYGRDAGNPVLWESSETPGELAKIAALSERLSGMCGSVEHVEGLALAWEG